MPRGVVSHALRVAWRMGVPCGVAEAAGSGGGEGGVPLALAAFPSKAATGGVGMSMGMLPPGAEVQLSLRADAQSEQMESGGDPSGNLWVSSPASTPSGWLAASPLLFPAPLQPAIVHRRRTLLTKSPWLFLGARGEAMRTRLDASSQLMYPSLPSGAAASSPADAA